MVNVAYNLTVVCSCINPMETWEGDRINLNINNLGMQKKVVVNR